MARRVRSANALIDLVVLEGPLAGQRLALDPHQSLLLGRSTRGVHLVDPLVSIEHAEVVWENDCYFLLDLRSATGTFIDGQPIGAAPVRLVPGMVISIGESAFLVEARQELPAWAVPLAFGSLAVAIGCAYLMSSWTQPVRYDPVLPSPSPIAAGQVTYPSLELPIAFIRHAGQDHRTMAIRRVTDFDNDGVSEVWFGTQAREWVISFDDAGAWRQIAALPAGCRDVQGVGMPVLRCGADSWHYDPAARVYTLSVSEGVTAWIRRPPDPPPSKDAKAAPAVLLPPAEPGALIPVAGTLGSPEMLAGFLADRGVTEPIHYLVCEGALPDVRPYVVTQAGEQVPLPVGCIRSIELSGTFPKTAIGEEQPMVLAVTSTGRSLFLRDLAASWGGNDVGLFLTVKQRALLDAASQEPVRLGTVLVDLIGARAERAFAAVAAETPIASHRRLLTGAASASPPATISELPGTGTYRVDPPGCHEVMVVTRPWNCASSQWCAEGSEFAEVRQVGCGRSEVLFRGYYANGSWRGSSDGIEVELQVDGVAHAEGFDVLRSRVGVRAAPKRDAVGG